MTRPIPFRSQQLAAVTKKKHRGEIVAIELEINVEKYVCVWGSMGIGIGGAA